MTEDEPIAVVVVGTRLPSERLGMPIKQAEVPPLNVSKAKLDDGAWYKALKYPFGMGCMASLGEHLPPSAKAKAVCHSFCLIFDLICLAISDPMIFPYTYPISSFRSYLILVIELSRTLQSSLLWAFTSWRICGYSSMRPITVHTLEEKPHIQSY